MAGIGPIKINVEVVLDDTRVKLAIRCVALVMFASTYSGSFYHAERYFDSDKLPEGVRLYFVEKAKERLGIVG